MGPARVHRHRHPVAAASPLRRDHRHRAPHRDWRLRICPRLQRHPAPHLIAASRRGRGTAGGRVRGRSRRGDLALPGAVGRDGHGGRRPRRRARRRPGSGGPSPGGHRQPRRGDHRARQRPDLRAEGVAAASRVAGERYRRRSGPRPGCARGYRAGRGGRRRSRAGWGDLRWPDRGDGLQSRTSLETRPRTQARRERGVHEDASGALWGAHSVAVGDRWLVVAIRPHPT